MFRFLLSVCLLVAVVQAGVLQASKIEPQLLEEVKVKLDGIPNVILSADVTFNRLGVNVTNVAVLVKSGIEINMQPKPDPSSGRVVVHLKGGIGEAIDDIVLFFGEVVEPRSV